MRVGWAIFLGVVLVSASCASPRQEQTSTSGRVPAAPTFNKDVAPILFAHCASCHRPGEVAPFSLLTFADARPRAKAIARATQTHLMPPWLPDPNDPPFVGQPRRHEVRLRSAG